MNKLNDSTVKLISSCQVISNLEVLIKELVENSLDAGATRIIINLKKFGLDQIDVIDDGSGIKDVSHLSQGHCTSKINNFSDIENVETFGFRGEVLSSICSISNLSIKSNCDSNCPLGKVWVFDKLGNVVAEAVTACNKGTTVSVTNIFQNLPVRRQIYKSLFVLQKTLKLITRYVQQLYLSQRNVQIRLVNDNNIILNYPQSLSRKQSINIVIGSEKCQLFNEIQESSFTNNGEEMKFDLFVPNCVNERLGLNNIDYKDACNLFVNNRPVEVSSIFKTIKDVYNKFNDDKRNRYPVCFLYLDLPQPWIDVNIDPDKRKIKIKNIFEVLQNFERHLLLFYETLNIRNESSNIEMIPHITQSINKKISNDIKPGLSSKIRPITHLKQIIPSDYDEDPTEMKSYSNSDRLFTDKSYLFNNLDSSIDESLKEKLDNFNTSLDESIKENCQNRDKNDSKNFADDIVSENASSYSLGKLHSVEGHPVRNVNLKRRINVDTDIIEPKLRTLEKSENIIEGLRSSNDNLKSKEHHCVAQLSLSSLNKYSDNKSNKYYKNTLTYLATWEGFIVALEETCVNGVNESFVIIMEKKNLVTASIFADKLRELQIPAKKMKASFLIDETIDELREKLEKIPVQLISNSLTGETYNILSCTHLLKNGFRIHCIKRDGKTCFEVVSRPVLLDDDTVVDEIGAIIDQSTPSGVIIRTKMIRNWIMKMSMEAVEKKMIDEVSKLTAKSENDFWNKCLHQIKKCDVFNSGEFSDLVLLRHSIK